jgi:hypothetical protein
MPDPEAARHLGSLLRGLRQAAGYRAARDAAEAPGCPAAARTIYAYEQGGLLPSLRQFLDLVEFYALGRPDVSADARYRAVAAVHAALSSPAYHVRHAMALIERLQPLPPPRGGP